MSTITIVKKNGALTLATDSLYSAGSLNVRPEYKVNNYKIYQVNQSYIALVGWGSIDDIIEDLIRNHAETLDFTNRASIFETLKNTQELLETEYSINTSENDDQPVDSNQLDGLVISPEGIFSFSSYRNVNEYSKFWSMGSGRDYALGAMYNAYDSSSTSQEIASVGVECSCVFDDGSCLPVQSVSIELKKA